MKSDTGTTPHDRAPCFPARAADCRRIMQLQKITAGSCTRTRTKGRLQDPVLVRPTPLHSEGCLAPEADSGPGWRRSSCRRRDCSATHLPWRFMPSLVVHSGRCTLASVSTDSHSLRRCVELFRAAARSACPFLDEFDRGPFPSDTLFPRCSTCLSTHVHWCQRFLFTSTLIISNS